MIIFQAHREGQTSRELHHLEIHFDGEQPKIRLAFTTDEKHTSLCYLRLETDSKELEATLAFIRAAEEFKRIVDEQKGRYGT